MTIPFTLNVKIPVGNFRYFFLICVAFHFFIIIFVQDLDNVKIKRKKYFVEGDEVAHKENLEKKLLIERVIKYKKSVTVYGQEQKVEKDFISGIQCGWWKGEEFVHGVFHSQHLIPWEIAQQGKEKVIEYLEQN